MRQTQPLLRCDTHGRATALADTMCSGAATIVTATIANAATTAIVADVTSPACANATFIEALV